MDPDDILADRLEETLDLLRHERELWDAGIDTPPWWSDSAPDRR